MVELVICLAEMDGNLFGVAFGPTLLSKRTLVWTTRVKPLYKLGNLPTDFKHLLLLLLFVVVVYVKWFCIQKIIIVILIDRLSKVLKKLIILPVLACKMERIAYIYYSNYKKDCYGTL
jgi:hypothetical protein